MDLGGVVTPKKFCFGLGFLVEHVLIDGSLLLLFPMAFSLYLKQLVLMTCVYLFPFPVIPKSEI